MIDTTNHTKQELWGILMKLADPADLIRSILNDAPGQHRNAGSLQSIYFLEGCSVTVIQHVVNPPEPPAPLDAPA